MRGGRGGSSGARSRCAAAAPLQVASTDPTNRPSHLPRRSECLHGVDTGDSVGGTLFPQPISLAASFDRDLMERVASAVGDELRAKSNEAQQQGQPPRSVPPGGCCSGWCTCRLAQLPWAANAPAALLSRPGRGRPDRRHSICFGPVLNIARDPRWGRVSESYGEDPFLTADLARVFVR